MVWVQMLELFALGFVVGALLRASIMVIFKR
jgi:hypothetical protein